MTRPTEWAPLAASDPMPGDPDRLAVVARRHGGLADLLAEQARTLREVAGAEGWDSDAGRVYSRLADKLAGRLDQARRRYSVVAETLGEYAPRLRQAQQEADAVRLAALDAQQRIDANAPQPAAAASPDQVILQQQRQAAHTVATGDLDRARRRLDSAARDRDAAATSAARRIQDVAEHDGLRDGFWDKVKGWTADRWNGFTSWVHEHAASIKFIADLASKIATVLSVIAIVISFIPVLDFLSPILLGMAAGLTAIALVCHMMLALSGDGSWVDVGVDLFALVTFGYGRVAAGALRASRVALRVAARRAITSGLRKSARAEVQAMSRQLASRTTGTTVRRGVRRDLARMQGQLRRQATNRVSRLEQTRLSLGRRLVHFDGTLAKPVGGTRAIVAHVRKLEGQVDPKQLARVEAAGHVVRQQIHRMAGVGVAAFLVDLGDRETSLALPDGRVLDLDGPLPDKGSVFDPWKEATRWGRYAGTG